MRFILCFKLDNGGVISFITEAQNMAIARSQAVQLSSVIFREDYMKIKDSNSITHSERWGKDKIRNYKPGNKNYSIAFLFNGQPQYVTTDGSGYKSAYNNVVYKFGLNNDTPMFIYEPNQVIVRKDAMITARQLIKDGKSLGELSRTVGRVMQSDQRLNRYLSRFGELVTLLRKYKSREYLNISTDKLISLVAVMVYISDTSNYSLESCGINDTLSAVISIINNMSGDVQAYKIWLAGGDKDNIVIC